MKRKRGWALIIVFLLVFQVSPLATVYGQETLGTDSEGSATSQVYDGSTEKETTESKDTTTSSGDSAQASESTKVESSNAIKLTEEANTSTASDGNLAAEAAEVVPAANEEIAVSMTVTGLRIADSGFLEEEEWAHSDELTFESGTTVLEATISFFDAQITEGKLEGYEILDFGSPYLNAITKDGVTLAGANSGSIYSYWELLVNDAAAQVGASDIVLNEGDAVEWRYNDAAEVAFAEEAIEISITGVETVGGVSTYVPWLQSIKYYNTEVSALAATLAVLDRYGMEYVVTGENESAFLDSITKADGTITLGYTVTEDGPSYWEFLINSQTASVGANGYTPTRGDSITFRYLAAGENAPVEVVVDPDAPRPDYSSDNAGFTTDRVVSSQTPTALQETVLAFQSTVRELGVWETGYSDLLLVNNNIYVASGQSLYIFDGTTGELLQEATLANAIGYTSRPVYTDGIIVVPLDGGRLQAFTADNLTCVWITDALSTSNGSHQSNTTLTVSAGYIYYGTSVVGGLDSAAGSFLCVDAATGAVIWEIDNDGIGYYWDGAVVVEGYVYIADDSGTITSYGAGAYGGYVAGRVDVGTGVRSTLTSDGTYLYCVDTAGTLWRIGFEEWGALREPTSGDSLSFAAISNSSPVISDGKLFVGGANSDGSGVLAVVDLESFALEYTISAPAQVYAAPLVVIQGSETYVYFTYNDQPGGILCYRLGDTAAQEIFAPTGDGINWCISSVVASSDGYLYYVNDSGLLFALRLGDNSGGSGDPVIPVNPEQVVPSSSTGSTVATTGGSETVVSVDATTDATTDETDAETTDTVDTDEQNTSGESSGTMDQTNVAESEPGADSPLMALSIAGVGVAVVGLAGAAVWFIRSRGVI